MKVTLYTTHCPRCTVLESKLRDKGIEYEEVTDISTMLSLGISTVPRLSVEDQPLKDFKEAIDWVNSLGGK